MVPFELFLRIHGIGTLVVALIAFLVRYFNAKRSTKDRFVGWWVFALVVGGYFTTGVLTYMQSRHIYFAGFSMCGGLVGLISGNVIGAWIWTYYRKEIEGEDDDA